MQSSTDPEFPQLHGSAYRVRAQVDVLMPGEERLGLGSTGDAILEGYRQPDGLSLGELQRTARNVLRQTLSNHAAMNREIIVEASPRRARGRL